MQSFPLVTSIGSSHCGDCHLWTTSASRRQMCVNLRKRQMRFKDSMKVTSSSSSYIYIYICTYIYIHTYIWYHQYEIITVWSYVEKSWSCFHPLSFANAFAFAMDPFRFPPLRVALWCREGHGARSRGEPLGMGMVESVESPRIGKYIILYHGIIDIYIYIITMVYGTYNYSYWGESKPTNITGGPHIVYNYIYTSGWWFGTWLEFFFRWEFHNPNSNQSMWYNVIMWRVWYVCSKYNSITMYNTFFGEPTLQSNVS